jgi:beta-lactamase regulating signal transducer with metallopeptidase domain
MLPFLHSGSLAALGRTLLNSVWQMGALWLLYLLLTGNHKRFSAAARHNLALLLAASGCGWFLYSLLVPPDAPGVLAGLSPVFIPAGSLASWITPLLNLISLVYLLVLLYACIRYLLGFYQLRMLRLRTGRLIPEGLQAFADRMLPVMGIRRRVRVFLVHWTDTAQTIGFIRPLIFLPVALLTRLSSQQVETILLHELQHIRRNDYLINIGMMIFRTLFFFNPFARFFFRAVTRERELACDDSVLQWNYPVPVYAEALFALESFRQTSVFSLAADGNNPRLLADRIRRVAGLPASGRSPRTALLGFSLMAALFLMAAHFFTPFSRPGGNIESRSRQAATAHPAGQPETIRTILLQETRVLVDVSGNTEAGRSRRRPARKTFDPAPQATQQVPVVIAWTVAAPAGQPDEEHPALLYADQVEVRNYSNEQMVASGPMPMADPGSAPYIPSVSFSYQPAADTLIPEALLQQQLKAMLALEKVKNDQIRAAISQQMQMKKEELKQMEAEHRRLLERKQNELKPFVEKIRSEIRVRQEAIKALQKQLAEIGAIYI